jgi:pyridoxamine 5'-phosphate oxidase
MLAGSEWHCMTDLARDLRKEYATAELLEANAPLDPFVLFVEWFQYALVNVRHEPNAMALATVDAAGRPAVRFVLMKDFEPAGIVFYTNYESRKARELAANPIAAAVFWWPELERQVRVEGRVERVGEAESDAYFKVRPRSSQVGAAASRQSEIIVNRDVLEARVAELLQQYGDNDLPRPAFWGGYRLRPTLWEFWQGRPSRLHDRLQYTQNPDGTWARVRLSP